MGLWNSYNFIVILLITFTALPISVSTGSASTVTLQWDANTEPDLAGYKVYHSAESSPLEGAVPLDVSNQTTATISGLDPAKSYRFAVSAYNTSGLESSFSNIVTLAEQLAPTVAITLLADSAAVSGAVVISVDAADNVGVTRVEYYINGELKMTVTGAPYVYSWDSLSVAPGPCTLMARAYDAAGNVSQSSRTVTVVNDLIAPTVALTAPANNATLNGTVTISSSASDNVGVTMVEFYINGILQYAGNLPPYSFSWETNRVSNGNYTIMAKAYDNAGHATQSSAVTVEVNNPLPGSTNLTIADALLALQIGSGKVMATSEQLTRLDVAPVVQGKSLPDGKVDTGDAIVLLARIVGKAVL